MEGYDPVNQELSFIEVDAPEANTPYLFEAASDKPFSSITSKLIPQSSLVEVEKDGFSFIGVNERTHLVSGVDESGNPANVTYYGYRLSDHSFVKVGTGDGAWINPFRAYIKTTSLNAGARINVLFDGEGGETGIQVMKPAVETKGEQPIYNLSGQRVKTPNKKGIYIIGGKKFIVK